MTHKNQWYISNRQFRIKIFSSIRNKIVVGNSDKRFIALESTEVMRRCWNCWLSQSLRHCVLDSVLPTFTFLSHRVVGLSGNCYLRFLPQGGVNRAHRKEQGLAKRGEVSTRAFICERGTHTSRVPRGGWVWELRGWTSKEGPSAWSRSPRTKEGCNLVFIWGWGATVIEYRNGAEMGTGEGFWAFHALRVTSPWSLWPLLPPGQIRQQVPHRSVAVPAWQERAWSESQSWPNSQFTGSYPTLPCGSSLSDGLWVRIRHLKTGTSWSSNLLCMTLVKNSVILVLA